jgi:uncharacterized protein
MPRTVIGNIPALWYEPKDPGNRTLIIFLTGFSGSKDSVEGQLKQLAEHGYYAVSYDPYQHGERRIETNPELVARVRGNIRRYFWPILAQTAEEVTQIIDWAVQELKVRPEVGMGGVSMGGDISVAAAGVDRRIKAVSACVATPDWLRPGSFEPPGEPDEIAQAAYDRRNPLTNLQLYRHQPAIAFQSGAGDHQVPPDGGERFVKALGPTYGAHPERLKVFLYSDTAHAFTPAMWEGCVRWWDSFLR